jgi:multiple sugar transport system permease protein
VSRPRDDLGRIAGPYDARPAEKSAPVAVVNFMNYEGCEWGKIAAGGTMVMLPVLFFSILVRKFLVHGLTAGALKG